jgi:hypothetical protein
MNRKKIGQIFFWFGIICIITWQALTWLQSPVQRTHTAEELSETIHAIGGVLYWIRIMGGSGLMFVLVGVFIYTTEKGSYFWLLGSLPSLINFGLYWKPSQHIPWLFGIGGTIILLSYIGILWLWMKAYSLYTGAVRTGRQIQLLGYSFLVATGLFLCMYFGNPKQLALESLPIPSGEIINITLSIGMLMLFVGHYIVARGSGRNSTKKVI